MGIRTTIATGAVLAVTATGVASAAPTSTAALKNCGKVAAGGKSWIVEAAGLSCTTARTVVRQVATKKPDRVLRAQGGEIDQYKSSFSGLKCLRTVKAKLGGAINCTSTDGRRSVYGIYKL